MYKKSKIFSKIKNFFANHNNTFDGLHKNNHLLQDINREMIYIKCFKKPLVTLVLGLFTAIIIYPFLHEIGHCIAIVLFGGKVKEFHLLPLPYVLCEDSSISNGGIVIVGIAGNLFPLFSAMIIIKKPFALWYIAELIIGISIYACVISVVALILANSGIIIPNEDVVKVVQITRGSELLVFSIIIVILCVAFRAFLKNKPIKRMVEYLE